MKKLKLFSAVLFLFVLCLNIASCGLFHDNFKTVTKKDLTYQSNLIEKLNAKSEFEAKEVFDFDFDRGYIIEEVYADGDSIAGDLGLNTNREQIKGVATENSRRIVFVNAQGDLIFDFLYNEVYVYTESLGTIIYPDTIIKKAESKYEDTACFVLDGKFDYYNK